MWDQHDRAEAVEAEAPVTETPAAEVAPPAETVNDHAVPQDVAGDDTPALHAEGDNGTWHAEAGRKGALRRHQLIKAGLLYEQEHGLKSGRQRLRQLIELGRLYEEEHGLRPARERKGGRLSRVEREELLKTFLECLVRIAKPTFRAELSRLVEALPQADDRQAA
jgi:hypothetical protein